MGGEGAGGDGGRGGLGGGGVESTTVNEKGTVFVVPSLAVAVI